MDVTAKPLRIPLEMPVHVEKHDIFDLFQYMVRNLVIDQPEDPIEYLINLLKMNNIDVPRVVLLGPPASGKYTVAKELCEQTQAVHITFKSLLPENTVEEPTSDIQVIPANQMVKLIKERLWREDCIQRGWVLDGIPHTRMEALLLQELGVVPNHVVMLEAPDEILIKRNQGKRIDPVTEDVYHVTFNCPESKEIEQRLKKPMGISKEDTISRLLQYNKEAFGLQQTFSNCLKIVKADQSFEELFSQVLAFILCRPRSVAPRTPKVLLIGPPGCGKHRLASRISQKYKLVHISCGELLKAVCTEQTSTGELIKPYVVSGQQDLVPDDLVLKVLTERLSRLDCTTRGWVLHGFPRTVEQAVKLQEYNFFTSRVFFLDMTDDVVLQIVTQKAVDPVTGERYHSLFKPAPSPEVHARVKQNPRKTVIQMQQRLQRYAAIVPDLKAVYTDAVCVNVDQDPHTIFETVESWLVEQLPKHLSSI